MIQHVIYKYPETNIRSFNPLTTFENVKFNNISNDLVIIIVQDIKDTPFFYGLFYIDSDHVAHMVNSLVGKTIDNNESSQNTNNISACYTNMTIDEKLNFNKMCQLVDNLVTLINNNYQTIGLSSNNKNLKNINSINDKYSKIKLNAPMNINIDTATSTSTSTSTTSEARI